MSAALKPSRPIFRMTSFAESTRHGYLADRFREIRERQEAEKAKPVNVESIKKGKGK